MRVVDPGVDDGDRDARPVDTCRPELGDLHQRFALGVEGADLPVGAHALDARVARERRHGLAGTRRRTAGTDSYAHATRTPNGAYSLSKSCPRRFRNARLAGCRAERTPMLRAPSGSRSVTRTSTSPPLAPGFGRSRGSAFSTGPRASGIVRSHSAGKGGAAPAGTARARARSGRQRESSYGSAW